MRDCLHAVVEMAKGSASTAIVAAMTLQVMGHAREVRVWPEDYFADVGRAVAQDGALVNSCASEPAMGSPSRGKAFATTATRADDGGWILNGRKTWITGGRHLTHMLVKLSIAQEVGVILVRPDTPGVSFEETWGDGLSLRASDSHDLILDHVHVPEANLFPETGRKEPHPNGWFPMMMAAVYLGSALGARDAVIQYALERVPTALGKSIATLPKIQREIGAIDMQLQAAQTLFYDVADEWQDAPGNMARIATAKHFVVEAALMATEKALQVAGGRALTQSLPLERYFRDVRAGSMQPPSGDTALEIIGRAAIGEIPGS
jgi:alkylation response protein AidB-like acyl-CoA dehydrogenase